MTDQARIEKTKGSENVCPKCGGKIEMTGRPGHEKRDCPQKCYENIFKSTSGQVGFGNIKRGA